MGADLINKKFDDVEKKIDFLIEFCKTLQVENQEAALKIKGLEAELENKDNAATQFSEHNVLIQSKIDGLLKKLSDFSNSKPGDD